MPRTRNAASKSASFTPVEAYRFPEADSAARPEIGTQPRFRKKKPPQRYRYDSSLSPALDWDGQNGTRELGEWLLSCIEQAAQLSPPHIFPQPCEFTDNQDHILAHVSGLEDAVVQLRQLSKPFLNWAGKAERLSFDVPTLPLFVHERLSTAAILETVKGYKRNKQMSMFDLFGDPNRSITDQRNLGGRSMLGCSMCCQRSATPRAT